MATDYFQDAETLMSRHPLPSPSDTPYHSMSRRSSRFGTPGTEPSSTPPPLPHVDGRQTRDDVANDEAISVLDPRRFTPTLHASLVSEILSLRRELDSKHKLVEELEANLQTARDDNDALASQLSASTKDGRAARKQLQQLENGTFSALEEIAGERDKARETNADLKAKLETVQKKLRAQEEDASRAQEISARDKDTWDAEKRALERRVHISESRLKTILDELAAREPIPEERASESEGEDNTRDSGFGHESDTGSIRSSPRRRTSTRMTRHSRNLSNGSYRSIGRNYRASYMSGLGPDGNARMNGGLSLADELTFDEEEEELEELELDSDDFPEHEMRARRALESRQSNYPDEKAKRILGLAVGSSTMELEPSKINGNVLGLGCEKPQEQFEDEEPEGLPSMPEYVDTGVQFSPPPSPVRPSSAISLQTSPHSDVEANQSRKRVSAARNSALVSSAIQSGKALSMISSSSQTGDQPLSPPATPTVAVAVPLTPISPTLITDVASASTQTDPIENEVPEFQEAPKRAPPPPPISFPIPSIAIHPPVSAPPSPKEPILPPGTKSMGTQTLGDIGGLTRSVGMQTEPIRIDKRPVKLPPHLLPSAISSKPGTPEPGQERRAGGKSGKMPAAPLAASEDPSPRPTARQDLMSVLEKIADNDVEDRYPGNNDNGPLAKDKWEGLRRPFRTSSLFAGFEGPSSDEEDHGADLSEDEFRKPQHSTPMLSSRNLKNGRIFNNPPTPVPEDKEVESVPRPSEDSMSSSRLYSQSSTRTSFDKPAKVGKPVRGALSRQPSVRRSAMIQSGTMTHSRHSRTPSFESAGSSNAVAKPPFPVPTRSSSRRIPLSKSEGSQSPTSRRGGFSGRRPYGMQSHQRKDSLRKVRSAAVIQKGGRSRSRSPPLPMTPAIPTSPELPPLPNDVVAGHGFGHRHQLSIQTTHTNTGSMASVSQQTSVVDAIAATMVGEWMWKYVRKRKAFGGPESPGDVGRVTEENANSTINGVRHRRWVWISPYERAVLWSSKQPTSGSALLGKSGRKLTIQSVLDVADNTPVPRNAGVQSLFNRSILILTPARALKFTTVSRERHYIWLTALSFLAHSSSPIPDLTPLPPQPPPTTELPPRNAGATLRRTHVRDSVRLAKDRANPLSQRLQLGRRDPLQDWHNPQLDSPVADAAEPPSIPRGPYHGRKRSSTGPLAPPPGMSFRSFSAQQVPSIYSTGSSDLYGPPPSVPSSVYQPSSVMPSSRTSEASSSARHNFFDSMGTVRMEAFIEPMLSGNVGHGSSKALTGRRRGNSQWSSSTNDAHRGGGLYEDFLRENHDPFRGF